MPNEASAWPHHGAQAGTDGLSLPIFINYWLRVPRLAPKPQACRPRGPCYSGRRNGPSFSSLCVSPWLPLRPEVSGSEWSPGYRPRRRERAAATCPRRLEGARCKDGPGCGGPREPRSGPKLLEAPPGALPLPGHVRAHRRGLAGPPESLSLPASQDTDFPPAPCMAC